MSESSAAEREIAGVENGGEEPSASAGTAPSGRTLKRSQPKKQTSLYKELPILVIVAVGLAFLIKSLFVQAFFIPSASMEKTLHGCPGCTGDRVLVNKLVYDFRDPHRGEIVVFNGKNTPFNSLGESETTVKSSNSLVNGIRHVQSFVGLGGNPNESDFIKRVIAVGGDTISCPAIPGNATICKSVVVNGRPIDESSYLFEDMGTYSTTGGPQMGAQRVFPQQTVPKDRLFVMGDHRDDSEDSRPNGTIPVSNVVGRAFVKVWPPSRVGGLGVPKVFQHTLAATAHVGDMGAAPLAAVATVLPVAGLRRRRAGRRRAYRRSAA